MEMTDLKISPEKNRAFFIFVYIGKDLIRLDKQRHFIDRDVLQEEMYLHLKYDYNAQLRQMYYLFYRELEKRDIVGYVPPGENLKRLAMSFREIGQEIVKTVQRLREINHQFENGKLTPQKYHISRGTYETHLLELREQLRQTLWEKGLFNHLLTSEPCSKCGSPYLCKHKPLPQGAQAPKHNSNELSGNNSSHPGGAA